MRQTALKYLYSLSVAAACWITPSYAQQPAVAGKTNTIEPSASQLVAPAKKTGDSLLAAGKNILRPILSPVSLLKSGPFFKINTIDADINHTYLHDTSGLSTGILRDINSTIGYGLALDLSVANMPFEARLAGNNGIYDFYNPPYNNFTQFNFDHKKYLEQLRKQVLNKINPEVVQASVLSRINAVKSQYEASLKNEIRNILDKYQAEFSTALNLPVNITDLSVNDLSTLKNVIIPQDILENYRTGSELYQELSLGNYNPLQKDSLQKSALEKIKKYKALGEIYEKVTAWKTKFDNNSLVKELRAHLPFTPGNFSSFLKNPSNLVQVIKEHASLSGIQKMFLNITKLDIGVNPLSNGELNMQNLMNNGLNAEVTGKRSSAGIIYGSGNTNTNHWMQSGLNSFVSNEYSRLMGIKLGSGWNSSMKQSLSVSFYDYNASRDLSTLDPAMLQTGYLSAPARRDAVITWQSSFDISPKHKIAVDLSKSFGAYNNNFSEDSSVAKTNAFGNIFGNEGRSNFAAAIDYRGDLLKTDVQLSLKKAGLGYNNPGNMFVRRGESRIGLSLARKFLKQKLTIRYKTDYRNQQFDPAKKYTYSTFSNNVQLGYRLKRNTRFGVALRHNSYRSGNEGFTPAKGSSYSLQGDASYQFRLNGKKITNHFILTGQSFNIPMLTGEQYTSRTWLVSHITSVMLRNNLVTMSLQMNRSDNKDQYFNTSFLNTEVNYSYATGNKIQLGSGLGFYSNSGWNKQVGLKQQVSGTVLKKIDIAIDVTWKKAIETIRKELANQVYISSSVHYRF